MKKILILTAGFGDGHNAAARSLRDAIELLDEDSRAEVLDLFADSYGAFNTLARKTYLGMVQYPPDHHETLLGLLPLNTVVARRLLGQVRSWVEPCQAYEKNLLGLKHVFLNSLRLTWTMVLLADAAGLLRALALLSNPKPISPLQDLLPCQLGWRWENEAEAREG